MRQVNKTGIGGDTDDAGLIFVQMSQVVMLRAAA